MNSIAMCTYNGEKYIEEQLQSIIQQTMEPDEIIICDDCSQDNTVSIIKHTLEKWSGKWQLIVNEKNLGYKKNFQKAITLCSGDIIYLSDQDDVWDLKKIEIMSQTFADYPNAVLVFHDASLVNEKLQLLFPSFWNTLEFQPETFLLKNYNILFKRNVLQGSACAFKKIVFEKAMPFPPGAVHDEWLLLISITLGKVIPINNKLMQYRQGHNVLGGLPEQNIDKLRKWMLKYKNALYQHYNEIRRKLEIFHEYEQRYEVTVTLFGNCGIHEYNQFLRYRLQCITDRDLSIIKELFQYKKFFIQWSFSIKTLIKDYLAMTVRNNFK
jgi:glycosyltransferase involved in cell wall biosynthesis